MATRKLKPIRETGKAWLEAFNQQCPASESDVRRAGELRDWLTDNGHGNTRPFDPADNLDGKLVTHARDIIHALADELDAGDALTVYRVAHLLYQVPRAADFYQRYKARERERMAMYVRLGQLPAKVLDEYDKLEAA